MRINGSYTFPAHFTLSASMNPCPCGYLLDKERPCTCTPSEIKRYAKKISGPLLDRIDIHIQVPRLNYKAMTDTKKSESSVVIRNRVEKARQIQVKRLAAYHIYCNAQMNHTLIQKTCRLTAEAHSMLKQIFNQFKISARSYDRIIKVSQTIADLDNSSDIMGRHVAESIQFKNDIVTDE